MSDQQNNHLGMLTAALSEQEAAQLGRIIARQQGEQATVEQLTAQRLRLARAFAREHRGPGHWNSGRLVREVGHWIGTRSSVLALGGVAAVLVVGLGLGIGKYRSTLQWNQGNSVELSPEPLHRTEPTPKSAANAGRADEVVKGTWRNRGRGAVLVDGWLQAESQPLYLEWVQEGATTVGSLVRLEPGARARVLSVGDDGLVLSLEHGDVVVQGDARAVAPFEVFAGPYSVRSSDASYELGWSTETRNLVLSVREGQALLEENAAVQPADKGTRTSQRVGQRRQVISAGQRLELGEPEEATRPRGKELLRSGKRANTSPAPSARTSGDQGVLPEGAMVPDGATGSVPVVVDSGRWKALAESGQYREAVAAANAVGFDSVQANASASDLLLLADAARLGGAPGRARAALQLLRQNFPTHTNAAIAAFTLGRMAQELDHNDRAALKWYRTYLHQEPRGRMAEGARARVLKGALRVGTTEEVQAAARDYLAHHPSGSSAALARQSL